MNPESILSSINDPNGTPPPETKPACPETDANPDTPPLTTDQLQLFHTQIPFYNNPPEADSPSSMMVLAFLDGIKKGQWLSWIQKFQREFDRYQELFLVSFDNGLPGARLGGDTIVDNGSKRPRGIIKPYTGLQGAVFECHTHPEIPAPIIKQLLSIDPHVVACWTSVFTLGVEAIIRVSDDFESHAIAADAIKEHFKKRGLTLDPSSWKPFRISPVSFDPELWMNRDPVSILIPERTGASAVDLDEEGSTPFPIFRLPGIAGQMAKEIARVTTSQNETLAAAAVISIISASLGHGIGFSTGGERWTRPNLYLLPIAESGIGKGETFDLAARPFIDAEKDAIDAFNRDQLPELKAKLNIVNNRLKKLPGKFANTEDQAEKDSLLAELQKAERDKPDLERKIAAAPRFKVADVTKEKLEVIMQGQQGEALASISSEARGVLSVVRGRYNKQFGDEGFYCSAYSGDPITVDRIGRDTVIIKNPCLTVCWMVQSDVVRENLKASSMTESGLLPRFLMFNADAEPKVRQSPPPPIPIEIKNSWANLVRSLLGAYRSQSAPLEASVSTEALQVLGEYERENVTLRSADGDLSDLRSYVARWSENAAKLSLVLHCAETGFRAHQVPISRETACNAVEIMRWFSAEQVAILSAGWEEAIQSRCSELVAIVEASKGMIKIRDLTRRHHFEKGEIKRIVSESKKLKLLKLQKKGGGRPSQFVTSAILEESFIEDYLNKPDSDYRIIPSHK